MLSPGSPSKWQVQNSFSSTASLMYSESYQTEDESEMFSSEGETSGNAPGQKTCSLGKGGTGNSESPLKFVDQRDVSVENGQTGCSSKSLEDKNSASKRIPTEGDLRFARKCSELHGYVRPLLELLNGLKTGRFEKGLSTFQQSMAIDRLRKILGVLQKPELGEKYMGTILQVEVLLKVWFPQVMPRYHDGTSSLHNPMASIQPRWNQDQLHIPVKKRRLSWSDSDSQSSSSCKRFHEEERGQSLSDTSSWLSSSETTSSDLEDDSTVCANQKEMASELNLTENVSVPLQPKTDSLNVTPAPRATGKPPPLVIPPSPKDGSTVGTQDCSVSSTTPTSDSPADSEIDVRDAAVETQGRSKEVKGEWPKKQVNSKSYRTKMSST